MHVDVVIHALADRRRRFIIEYLLAHGPAVGAENLAEEIAVHETRAAIPDVPDTEVATIYAVLYHVHLPKLADAGLIHYDRDDDRVRLADLPDGVEALVSVTSSLAEESLSCE